MVKFISKRRNISFDACAFKQFLFITEVEYKINKLRNHQGYGKDFIEVPEGTDTNNIINKAASDLNIDELRELLAQKESNEKEAEIDNKKEKLPDGIGTGNVSKNMLLNNKESKPEDSNDSFNKMIDALGYNELKTKAKEKSDTDGIKFNVNQKKEILREFLKGK